MTNTLDEWDFKAYGKVKNTNFFLLGSRHTKEDANLVEQAFKEHDPTFVLVEFAGKKDSEKTPDMQKLVDLANEKGIRHGNFDIQSDLYKRLIIRCSIHDAFFAWLDNNLNPNLMSAHDIILKKLISAIKTGVGLNATVQVFLGICASNFVTERFAKPKKQQLKLKLLMSSVYFNNYVKWLQETITERYNQLINGTWPFQPFTREGLEIWQSSFVSDITKREVCPDYEKVEQIMIEGRSKSFKKNILGLIKKKKGNVLAVTGALHFEYLKKAFNLECPGETNALENWGMKAQGTVGDNNVLLLGTRHTPTDIPIVNAAFENHNPTLVIIEASEKSTKQGSVKIEFQHAARKCNSMGIKLGYLEYDDRPAYKKIINDCSLFDAFFHFSMLEISGELISPCMESSKEVVRLLKKNSKLTKPLVRRWLADFADMFILFLKPEDKNEFKNEILASEHFENCVNNLIRTTRKSYSELVGEIKRGVIPTTVEELAVFNENNIKEIEDEQLCPDYRKTCEIWMDAYNEKFLTDINQSLKSHKGNALVLGGFQHFPFLKKELGLK